MSCSCSNDAFKFYIKYNNEDYGVLHIEGIHCISVKLSDDTIHDLVITSCRFRGMGNKVKVEG